MKKMMMLATVMMLTVFLLSQSVSAFQLLSREEALKEIFGKSAEFSSEKKELSGEILAKIQERMGGQLVYVQEGSESKKVAEKHDIEFIFAMKDGEKYGVAIIDVEPGKWGPVEFIIAMDLKGTVKSVKVMSYQEKRGRPIARSSFTNQYKGKTSSDPIEVGKDITGISGATISSRSACFSVKKAIVMFEEAYLKK